MSIDRCSRCSDLVDTDNEPEAYVDMGNQRGLENWVCLCLNCRERYEEESDEPRQMPTDWVPTVAQQAIMDVAETEQEDET